MVRDDSNHRRLRHSSAQHRRWAYFLYCVRTPRRAADDRHTYKCACFCNFSFSFLQSPTWRSSSVPSWRGSTPTGGDVMRCRIEKVLCEKSCAKVDHLFHRPQSSRNTRNGLSIAHFLRLRPVDVLPYHQRRVNHELGGGVLGVRELLLLLLHFRFYHW